MTQLQYKGYTAECVLIKTRIYNKEKSLFVSLYAVHVCVTRAPHSWQISLIWGVSVILCTGLPISIAPWLNSRNNKQGRELHQTSQAGQFT